MYRFAIEQLIQWKDSSSRKPLILEGARQVGKTWLMKEFASQCYDNSLYINCEKNERIRKLFAMDLDVHRILAGLELYGNLRIEPDKTLIIFDEVQEIPEVLQCLKYFYENAPEYPVICAGSLLGIKSQGSFPVGKVDFLQLYPMSFNEFLLATGKERFLQCIKNHQFDNVSVFRDDYIESLKQYYFVGGMPECVTKFMETHQYSNVRRVQRNILASYERDFSKHAPKEEVQKINLVWNSLPTQLSRENKKFLYGIVRDGGRARDYENALYWLRDYGLIYFVNRVNSPKLPLKAYEDIRAFKLFMLDVGLLGCKAGLSPQTLLDGNKIFIEFKGAMTEQYVLQQLLYCDDCRVYYYTNDRSTCEIDFLVDDGDKIIPVEVKAELNLKAKSLKYYCETYCPELAIRTSMSDYKIESWLVNLPLYAIQELVNM